VGPSGRSRPRARATTPRTDDWLTGAQAAEFRMAWTGDGGGGGEGSILCYALLPFGGDVSPRGAATYRPSGKQGHGRKRTFYMGSRAPPRACRRLAGLTRWQRAHTRASHTHTHSHAYTRAHTHARVHARTMSTHARASTPTRDTCALNVARSCHVGTQIRSDRHTIPTDTPTTPTCCIVGVCTARLQMHWRLHIHLLGAVHMRAHVRAHVAISILNRHGQRLCIDAPASRAMPDMSARNIALCV